MLRVRIPKRTERSVWTASRAKGLKSVRYRERYVPDRRWRRTLADTGEGSYVPSRRILSLAPSATAILVDAGLGGCLVGATHHCDAPADVRRVGAWLDPDYEVIADRDPDLVCTSDALQRPIRDDLRERGFEVVHHEPSTLSAAVSTFSALPAAAGDPAAGEELRADAERRLDAVRDAVAGVERPVVYCEEWSDPPMAAGNWVPEAVRTAGGRYPFVAPGERSREVDHGEFRDADPDHVVLHVCGHGDRVDPATLAERGWDTDAAVHVVDDDLLNQPSPRLVDGVEALAELFHPKRFEGTGGAK
jgi:iron complex transport system substrate-binding protein